MCPLNPPHREQEDKEAVEERKPKRNKMKADKHTNTFSMDEEDLETLRESLQEATREILQDIGKW